MRRRWRISPPGGTTDRYEPVGWSCAAAAMIARSVRRQRPQSRPAPHAAATSLDVDAPSATASDTAWLVTPSQRQTYISEPPTSGSLMPKQPACREV
jgi:hypothetical protein